MLIALAGDEPFVKPRTNIAIDLDSIAARLVGSPTTKGMFFNRALRLVDDDDELLRAAGISETRFVPFSDYPWMDFVRLCATIGDRLHPGRRAAGIRQVGRTLYGEFADSLVGRVTFGLLRSNADRVIGAGPKAWNVSGIPGEVVGESIGDCHYRHHFVGYPAEIAETLGVGVIEGALAECGETARVLFGQADPMHAVLDIRWGDAP
jgi:uncharacterized protein (TIGR02265 family)